MYIYIYVYIYMYVYIYIYIWLGLLSTVRPPGGLKKRLDIILRPFCLQAAKSMPQF